MEKNYYDVGKIVNTHGIKGEVRVISVTNHPEERYKKGSQLEWFGQDGEQQTLIVESHRVHKSFDLVSFKNHANINYVEKYVGGQLAIEENLLDDNLEEHEYYIFEIIGLEVVDAETGEKIGTVKEVLSPGANDVWVVKRHKKKDLLLPYIESVVHKIDLDNHQVKVTVLEGLDD